MVLLHEDILALVATEPMFDLQPRNQEVEEVEEEEDCQVGVGLIAFFLCAGGDETFSESCRRDVNVDKQVDED